MTTSRNCAGWSWVGSATAIWSAWRQYSIRRSRNARTAYGSARSAAGSPAGGGIRILDLEGIVHQGDRLWPGPPDSFVITLDPISARFVPPDADDPARWLFRRGRPTPVHALALALRHERPAAVPVNARAIGRTALLRCGASPDVSRV
jgi:hypothetical protein